MGCFSLRLSFCHQLEKCGLRKQCCAGHCVFHENEQYEGSSHEIFYYIGLRKIILPEGLEKIGEGAFYQASALRQVNFPSTLRYIGDFAFNATKLEMNQLVIPEGVEEINQYAFAFCRKLKAQVTLPSTIKKLASGLFTDAPSLLSICQRDLSLLGR